jgi:hypothetical protein
MVAIAVSDQGIKEKVADETVCRAQRGRRSDRRIYGKELFEHGINRVLRNAAQLCHRVGLIDLLQEFVTVYERALAGQER